MNWISNSHLIKPPACSYFHRYPKAAVRGTAFLRALLCQIEFLAACTFPLPVLLLPALLPPPPTSTRRAAPIKQLFQSPSASSVFLHKVTYPFFKVMWPFQCQSSCCQCFCSTTPAKFRETQGGRDGAASLGHDPFAEDAVLGRAWAPTGTTSCN